ncbi:hypothetical protein EZS27_043483, partial [termite gut metagenome]
GTVGGSLIEQIRTQRQKLMEENGLKLNVVGIMDMFRALFCRECIDLNNYREELQEKCVANSTQTICDEVRGMNIFNSVFVDCTASPDGALLYTFAILILSANTPAAVTPAPAPSPFILIG